MYQAMQKSTGHIALAMTDAIVSDKPIKELPIGTAPGDWKYAEHSEACIWDAGIYDTLDGSFSHLKGISKMPEGTGGYPLTLLDYIAVVPDDINKTTFKRMAPLRLAPACIQEKRLSDLNIWVERTYTHTFHDNSHRIFHPPETGTKVYREKSWGSEPYTVYESGLPSLFFTGKYQPMRTWS